MKIIIQTHGVNRVVVDFESLKGIFINPGGKEMTIITEDIFRIDCKNLRGDDLYLVRKGGE